MPKVKVQVHLTIVVGLDTGVGFPSEAVLNEFRKSMFHVETGRDLIEHIAGQVALLRQVDFVKGVGPVKARILDMYVDYTDILT